MAISRVGAASADAATITIPGIYQAGDILVIYSFRNATTSPTLPSGWTDFGSSSAGASSYRLGYKIATSASETSGTWTNATGLVCHVYRGQSTSKTPLRITASSTNTNTNVGYNQFNLQCPGTSWLIGFAAVKSITSTIGNAPSGMTLVTDTIGANCEYVGSDTNGTYGLTGMWPSTNVALGVSAEWRSIVVELFAEQMNIENYKFIKVSDGMSVTERIR